MEASQTDATPLRLLDLPDELLRLCIEPVLDRRTALPLVCRRMQRLVEAPSLNATVHLISGDVASTLRRLQSLCTWLLSGAATHVQQLSISLPDDMCDLDDEEKTEVACVLSSMLTACGTLGSLQELRLLHGAMYFPCTGWLGTLRRLRRLHIYNEYYPPLSASLHTLCELEQLSLQFPEDAAELPPAVRLPPSITYLHLGKDGSEALPEQVASLTRLHSLSLESTFYQSDSYALLFKLTSLRRLAINSCSSLPACLPQLTGLVALSIGDPADALYDADGSALVGAALPRLTCLTHLALDDFADLRAPPPQLTCLTRLASLCWMGCHNPTIVQPLPPGSYLAGVRHLMAAVDVLFHSLPALGAAHSLERLGAVLRRPRQGSDSSEAASKQLLAVLQWTVHHPPLRVLALQADKESLGTAFFDAVRLLQGNPGIQLEPSSMISDPEYLRELCLGTA